MQCKTVVQKQFQDRDEYNEASRHLTQAAQLRLHNCNYDYKSSTEVDWDTEHMNAIDDTRQSGICQTADRSEK